MVRILRHLFMPDWLVKRYFSHHVMVGIERAIGESEAGHLGEIRFAVEAGLDFWPLMRGQQGRDRAVEVFSRLRVWDTEQNSGVLIYLLLADRDVEIIADRGIHAQVGTAQWQRICAMMEEEFRHGRFEQGVLAGIGEITALLVRHFPATGINPDELSNQPVVL